MKTTAGIAKKAMSREFEAAIENYNKLGKIIILRGALKFLDVFLSNQQPHH